jgi:RHS repeat-associated protein
MAYEPFGKRRQPVGPVDINNQIVGVATDRGFTTHEHLDELGLIHMNGRVYDSTIARFVSADPTIALADDLQSYNRYSYGYNDPMSGADPTGFTYVRACVADSSSKVCRWVNNGDGLEGYGGGGGGGTSSSVGGRGGGGAGKNSGTDPFAWIAKLLGKREEKTRPDDCQLICINQSTFLATAREFNTGDLVQDGLRNYYSKNAATAWNAFVKVGEAWADVTILGMGAAGEYGAVISAKSVSFAFTAESHMANPGRYVPTELLVDVINTSKAYADPKGSTAMMYYSRLIRDGKVYNLEVLYDSSKQMIFHFEYARKPMGPLSAIK